MVVLDVNVVLAAHRRDHPQHEQVRRWFDGLTAGNDPFSVPLVVWGSFLRLATNRRIFPVPSPLTAAFDFIDATAGQPNHLVISPGPRHLALVRSLCEEADATGDLVPDVVIAAIAAEHSAEVVTLDRDFARFTSVRSHRPS